MIATVTFNPAVDYTVSIGGELTDGEVARSESHRYDPGGKGINVTKFLDAMGVPTVATAPVGGFVGNYLADRLAADDVPTDFVRTEGLTRLNATVHAADSEYKVNQPGPSLGDDDLDAVVSVLSEHDPDTVVVAGSLPPGLDVGAVDRIAAAGQWGTVVDLGGDDLAALEAAYALCKPNREELAAATGRDVQSVDDALAAADELRSQGFQRVLASLGGDGAILVGSDLRAARPAADAEVVDTVGAGDALLSGYLAGVHDGLDPERALERGIEVATAVVGLRGPSVPPSL